MITKFKIFIILAFGLFYNNSCTSKVISNNVFNKNDSATIDFFLKVGFKIGYINKWDENILYSFIDQPHAGDSLLLDTIFTELNQIIKPLKIMKAENNEKANLHIYFGNKMGNKIPESEGLSRIRINNFIIKIGTAAIWADPKTKGKRRQFIFRHEMLHVLGLVHPPKDKIYENIIFPHDLTDMRVFDDPDFVLLYKYTELDLAVLKMVYDTSIPNGLSIDSFREAYKIFLKTKNK
jgi:hypothetical protein